MRMHYITTPECPGWWFSCALPASGILFCRAGIWQKQSCVPGIRTAAGRGVYCAGNAGKKNSPRNRESKNVFKLHKIYGRPIRRAVIGMWQRDK